MAKEEKPIEYQRRVRDTKKLAQRLDFDYLKRPAVLGLLKRQLTWALVAVATIATIALVLGGSVSKKAFLSGPVSSAHAIFEGRCDVCHSKAFGRVPDGACLPCHDGPAHPAKVSDTARLNVNPPCAGCHVEHRGEVELAQVSNGNCTNCHSNLKAHATGVKLTAVDITAFRLNRHPEFSAASMVDARPLKLNHAAHLPAQQKVIRGMKLPMKCIDCHVTDPNSPTGNPLPVTFEAHCKSCHEREMEFDVYQLLGPVSMPSPHAKDTRTIHEFIVTAYRKTLDGDPAVVKKPLGNDLSPAPSAAAWLDRVVNESEKYLFERKCTYCHEYSGTDQGFPVVKKVSQIRGRFVEGKPEGENWFQRGEFSHRAHRMVQCESCHTSARTSTKTADVLIPSMRSCLACHAVSGAGLDRCSECHLYHNKSLEKERERRPPEQIVSALRMGVGR